MSIKERREREEQARHRDILSAAEAVFTRNGYFNARMEDIAEAAELAKGTLYYYFKSKDEIFVRLLERESRKVNEEIRRRIPEDCSFREALEQIVAFSLEYFEKNRSFLKMVLPCMCGFIAFKKKDLVARSTQGFEAHGEFIREILSQKIRQEGLPIRVDELLEFIKTMQIGIGLKLLEGRRDEAQAAARFFLDLIRRNMEETS